MSRDTRAGHEARAGRGARHPGFAALFTSRLLVRRRLRSDLVTLLGIMLLIAVTSALAVTVPSQLSGARDRAAREAIETAGRDADLLLNMAVADSLGSASVTAAAVLSFATEVPDRLPPTIADASAQITTGILSPELDGTGPAGGVHARIGVLDPAAAGAVQVVDGELPSGGTAGSETETPAVAVAVSAATADMAGVGVGQSVSVGVPWLGTSIALQIVGIVETKDASAQPWADLSGLWEPQELAARGIRSGAAFTVLADAAGFDAVSGNFGESSAGIIRTSFDPAAFNMDRFVAVRDSVDALETSSDIDEGTVLSVAPTSGYEDALSGFLAAVTAATSHLSTLAAGLLGVAVLVTVLASTALVQRRRAETALLRSRGASIGLVVAHSAVESIVITLLGGLLGVGAALALGVRVGSLLLLGAAAGIIVTAPVVSTLRQVVAGLSATRALLLRIVAASVLVATAVTAVVALRGGSGEQTRTLDPLALVAPVLCAGVVALALAPVPGALIRLLPRLTSRTRGPGALLAGSSARDGRSIVTLMALTLASSVAITSLVLLQTVALGQQATSWRAVGADVRVEGASDPAALVDDYAAAGATATALTELTRVDVEGTTRSIAATLFAVDDTYPSFIAALPAEHRDFAAADIRALLDLPAPTTADPVPILVDARLASAITGETATIIIDETTIPVTVTQATLSAPTPPSAPTAQSTPTAVVDRARLEDYLASQSSPVDATGEPLAPTTVMAVGDSAGSVDVRGNDGADDSGAGDGGGKEVSTVLVRDEVLAELRAGELVDGISVATAQTLLGTAALAVLALVVTTIVGVRRRGRTLALLGALGMHKRTGVTLASGELLPLVLGGVICGSIASAAVLSVAAAAFRTDVLAGGPAPISAPLWLPPVILGLAAAAFLVAVLVDIPLSRRVRTADILRTGEES